MYKRQPFVNAETTEYLVLEDAFPNGRPPLERAGVYFTDRATVEKAEKMKVGTCLNPLHLSLIHIFFIDGGVIVEDSEPKEFFAHPKNKRLQDFLSKML